METNVHSDSPIPYGDPSYTVKGGNRGTQEITPAGRTALAAEIARLDGTLESITTDHTSHDSWTVTWQRSAEYDSDFATSKVYIASFPALRHGEYDMTREEARLDALRRSR